MRIEGQIFSRCESPQLGRDGRVRAVVVAAIQEHAHVRAGPRGLDKGVHERVVVRAKLGLNEQHRNIHAPRRPRDGVDECVASLRRDHGRDVPNAIPLQAVSGGRGPSSRRQRGGGRKDFKRSGPHVGPRGEVGADQCRKRLRERCVMENDPDST